MTDHLKLMTEKLRELKTYNERIRGCKIERGLQRKKVKEQRERLIYFMMIKIVKLSFLIKMEIL